MGRLNAVVLKADGISLDGKCQNHFHTTAQTYWRCKKKYKVSFFSDVGSQNLRSW